MSIGMDNIHHGVVNVAETVSNEPEPKEPTVSKKRKYRKQVKQPDVDKLISDFLESPENLNRIVYQLSRSFKGWSTQVTVKRMLQAFLQHNRLNYSHITLQVKDSINSVQETQQDANENDSTSAENVKTSEDDDSQLVISEITPLQNNHYFHQDASEFQGYAASEFCSVLIKEEGDGSLPFQISEREGNVNKDVPEDASIVTDGETMQLVPLSSALANPTNDHTYRESSLQSDSASTSLLGSSGNAHVFNSISSNTPLYNVSTNGASNSAFTTQNVILNSMPQGHKPTHNVQSNGTYQLNPEFQAYPAGSLQYVCNTLAPAQMFLPSNQTFTSGNQLNAVANVNYTVEKTVSDATCPPNRQMHLHNENPNPSPQLRAAMDQYRQARLLNSKMQGLVSMYTCLPPYQISTMNSYQYQSTSVNGNASVTSALNVGPMQNSVLGHSNSVQVTRMDCTEVFPASDEFITIQ